jgi:hypothetical protein
MSEYKGLHTDVLFVIADDLIKQAESGKIEETECLLQVRLILQEVNGRLVQRMERSDRRLDSLEMDFKSTKETYEQTVREFFEFLDNKGLRSEFDDFMMDKEEAEFRRRDGDTYGKHGPA